MNKSLFRNVFQYNNTRWRGKALITTFFPSIVINSIALLFIAIFISFILFAHYHRRIQVNGEIITQYLPVNVYAPQQGYVIELLASVGDNLKKGDPLYRLDVNRVTQQGKLSQNMVNVIQDQLKQIDSLIKLLEKNKDHALENTRNQLKMHQDMYQKTLKLLNDSEKELARLKLSIKDYKNYLGKGLVTKDEVNYQQYLYQQHQNTHQNFYSQLIQEELQLTNLTSDLTTQELKFSDQILQYEDRRYELQKQLLENNANDTIMINSPTEGKLESLSVTLGQMVNTGDSLAQILPQKNNPYYAVLWLPNTSVAYVHIGDKVNIRYDAFPFEKFGQFPGKIISISSVPTSKQELSQYNSVPHQFNTPSNSNYYKAIVALPIQEIIDNGKALTLTSGMTLQSTLFLEKRALYQWMFTPIYRINKSISGAIHGSE